MFQKVRKKFQKCSQNVPKLSQTIPTRFPPKVPKVLQPCSKHIRKKKKMFEHVPNKFKQKSKTIDQKIPGVGGCKSRPGQLQASNTPSTHKTVGETPNTYREQCNLTNRPLRARKSPEPLAWQLGICALHLDMRFGKLIHHNFSILELIGSVAPLLQPWSRTSVWANRSAGRGS